MVVRLSMVYKILILSFDIKVTAFDNMKNDNEYVAVSLKNTRNNSNYT